MLGERIVIPEKLLKQIIQITQEGHQGIVRTRNTCMQQPLAYIFQTLFLHEVFVITPTLNAGSRFTSCLSWQHDNCFLIFCTNCRGKTDEI
jgi:hypothetical protein